MNKNKLIWLLIFIMTFSCKEQNNQSELEKTYSINFSKFIENCWNNKDFLDFDKIIHKNYSRIINNVSVASSPNELKANIKVYHKGFPDLFIEINKVTFKDNLAFLAWTFNGTNTGIFGEKAATGKKVEVHGYTNVEFNKEGMILKEEIYYNELDFLQQLGYTLIPPNIE
ncbi:MAG: ester cyclase [Flavobacteriaceae bacterium]|nr:ester cyclase [Flavobacteriaceae bacterium]